MRRALLLVSGLLAGFLAITFPMTATEEPSFCGPHGDRKKYVIVKHKGEHPKPRPPADKALVYVVSGYWALARYGMRVAVNGKWAAYVRRSTYAYFEAEPGLLKFCGENPLSSRSYLFLTVEGGKAYFVQTNYGGELKELDSSDGERLLKSRQFVTMGLKR